MNKIFIRKKDILQKKELLSGDPGRRPRESRVLTGRERLTDVEV